MGNKSVVKPLDLVLLLGADSLDGGVDGHVERCQQTLVNRHGCDGSPHVRASAGLGSAGEAHGPAAERPCLIQASAAVSGVPLSHDAVVWMSFCCAGLAG